MSSIYMEEGQNVENSEGPARSFKPPNGPNCDQRLPGRFVSKIDAGPPECSIFDSLQVPGSETPTVSVYNRRLLENLPIHINFCGPDLSMSDVPHMTGGATPFSAIEELREGGDNRHNALNLLGTWTSEDEQMFYCQPSAACNAEYMRAITRPFNYIMSLLGKNVHSQLLSAFDVWLQVDERSYNVIDKVFGMLHNASLFIDDIQDGSDLRRGSLVAHRVLGEAQTINSANYAH